jgi:ABC-type amino acid transport substrate-binding protein
MKVIYVAILLIQFLPLPSKSQNIKSASWNEIRANKAGTLYCLWNESYGIIWKDNKGAIRGVCADILNDFKDFVKQKHQVDLTLNFAEEKVFEKFLEKVATSPGVLGVSSVTMTEHRRKTFQFSPHYLANPNVLVSNRNAKQLNKLEDLSGSHKTFKVKVIKGSSHERYANIIKQKYNPQLVIELSTSSREIFDEMVSNRALLTITDCGEFLGAKITNKEIMLQKVDIGFVDKMGFIMEKKSDWYNVFQEFLTDDYRESAKYRKIVFDNLGSNYLTLVK